MPKDLSLAWMATIHDTFSAVFRSVVNPSPCLEKLDRLGWVTAIAGVNHGVRLGIRTTHESLLGPIASRLPPRWRSSSPTNACVDRLYSLVGGGPDPRYPHIRRFHLAYAGARLLCRSLYLDEVLDAFESDLHFFIAQSARLALFVHAGVVGWHGTAIVIPGRTLVGKTTLVAALVKAGATYYSDEYAVFQADGCVRPYPKALSFRNEGSRPTRFSPEELGATIGRKPLRVGLVVVTKFRSGACWRPVTVSPGRAALHLLANTVCARTRPSAALAMFAQAATNARTLRGIRGEAYAAAASILEEARKGHRVLDATTNDAPFVEGR